MEPYDAVLMSDPHLGSKRSRPKQLLRTLVWLRKNVGFNRLIFVGDFIHDFRFFFLPGVKRPLYKRVLTFIVHFFQATYLLIRGRGDLNLGMQGMRDDITDLKKFQEVIFPKLSMDERRVVRYVCALSKTIPVILIEGNHDENISLLNPALAPITAVEQYSWEYNGQRFLALHGHQFDKTVQNQKQLAWFVAWIYNAIEKFVPRFIANAIERAAMIRYNRRVSREVPRQAAEYAFRYGVTNECAINHVIAGHTHQAVENRQIGNIAYHNCGCWTSRRGGTYITVGVDGVRLRHEDRTRNI